MLLVAFDSDENKQIDEREIDNALTMTLQWAGIVRTTPGAKWFVASDGNAIGPKTWSEIEAAAKTQTNLLISLENTDFWLPYEAVVLAK